MDNLSIIEPASTVHIHLKILKNLLPAVFPSLQKVKKGWNKMDNSPFLCKILSDMKISVYTHCKSDLFKENRLPSQKREGVHSNFGKT